MPSEVVRTVIKWRPYPKERPDDHNGNGLGWVTALHKSQGPIRAFFMYDDLPCWTNGRGQTYKKGQILAFALPANITHEPKEPK